MTKAIQTAGLWPSTQLLVTADTREAEGGLQITPRAQLRFLTEMAAFTGPESFAESLVYSTPRGNTGWTAFRMGRLGHATYHHWDMATPNLLQLDLFGIGTIDDQRAISSLEDFWLPTALRTVLATRPEPSEEFTTSLLRDDLARRTVRQTGLGPGDHLHLLLDQTGATQRRKIRSPDLSIALVRLVEVLKMRGMTPVMKLDRIEDDGLAYDAIVGITTSHVSMRLRQTGDHVDLSLDVFSCRKFDVGSVFKWLDNLLPSPRSRRAVLYNRYPLNEFRVVS